ncbi:glycosyltransferase [Buttiauxella sp. A2-C1_F]|uniref:glycosyltransferase n=1 Tax=Buttiauxella sp. A2-C1_F TaxID=2904526 RepID=UPI001E65A92C|nr:glycosyltransferase [Buttiauxella sp. A2-C1_F]MCE0846440.1 glycosyltransferase [Buttiauxella sp. A2-C1_F]
MNSQSFISIALVTYQSASTVVQTLNSIVNQSYGAQNIELIISDDGSTDTTVITINSWIKEHGKKFQNVKLLVSENNNGTVYNLEQALRACSGQWIKTIAGDDILLPSCLSSFKEYSTKNQSRVIFSQMSSFQFKNEEIRILDNVFPDSNQKKVLKAGIEEQKKHLQHSCFAVAPTTFIEKNLLEEVGYLNLNFRLLEDYPLWIKIIEHGVRFSFLDEITVLYRIGESTSRTNDKIVNLDLMQDLIILEKSILSNHSDINKLQLIRRMVWVYLYPEFISKFKNKRTFLSKYTLLVFNSLFKIGFFKKTINNLLRAIM